MAVWEMPEAKSAVAEMGKSVKSLSKQWAQLQRALDGCDRATLSTVPGRFREELANLEATWQAHQDVFDAAAQSIRDHLDSDDYREQVEEALRNEGIPFHGEFPSYQFAPFRLELDLEGGSARLYLGRRQEKTTTLHPIALGKWVNAHYGGIVRRRFDPSGFCRDLMNVYEVANRLAYGGREALWGRAVSLSQLYELMTLRQTAKQEYPRLLFEYHLARLKEEYEVHHNGQRFEFGFARNQGRAFLLVDSKGREQRVSSLTIYEQERAE